MLYNPIQEHEMSFHLLKPLLVFFRNIKKFFLVQVCTIHVKFVCKYLLHFEAVVNGVSC